VGMGTNIPLATSAPIPLDSGFVRRVAGKLTPILDSLASAWLLRRPDETRIRAHEALGEFDGAMVRLLDGASLAKFIVMKPIFGRQFDCMALFGVIEAWVLTSGDDVDVIEYQARWDGCDFKTVTTPQIHGAFRWQGADYIFVTEFGWDDWQERHFWRLDNGAIELVLQGIS